MKQLLLICTMVPVVLVWLPTPIGSAPAARQTDYQACPMMCSPYVPHVGGPIIDGEPSVLICGQPAARISNHGQCNCGLATISLGCATVLIGGMPAARQGDITNHGGTILTGCTSVLIGP